MIVHIRLSQWRFAALFITMAMVESSGALAALAASRSSATQPDGESKVVALDCFYNHEMRDGKQYHYTWDDKTPSGFSKLGGVFEEQGAKLARMDKAPTAESLSRCSIYIITDPDIPAEAADGKPNYIEPEAIDAIAKWVESGGALVLMNNDKGNAEFEHVNQLAARFGIAFNEDSRNKTRARIETKGLEHALFRDVAAISIKGICTLSVTEPAKAILSAEKETGPGKDALMAECHYGKGLVFAVGDPWLYNEYIDFAPQEQTIENRKAAVNLARWLLSANTSPHFSVSNDHNRNAKEKNQ